jgi:NAD(P)-dependent dehydrogenase (short-subunit alcohol dehydrogenase family)
MKSDQKIAFITGANRGIGLETARSLGKLGILVILGSRDSAKGQSAVAELQTEGITAETIAFDATLPGSSAAAFDYIESHHGKLDILVNNAGIIAESMFGENASSVEIEVLKETFNTNFFSVVELTQALLPLLRKSSAGRIVNLSSILGSLTIHSLADSPIDPAKALAYNASKTALNAFTVHLAHELRGTAIKVNSAHPGWVKTDMGGSEAPVELKDGANTSVRLATLDETGPSGGFFNEGETLPW